MSNPIKVRVGNQNAVKVVSSLAGNVSGTLAGLSDVEITNPQNGMILVYNSATNRLAAQAYVSILGNLGIALASLSAINDD